MASKNRVVTFKLSDAEAQLLAEKVVAAGYKNKSEYFRKEVLNSDKKAKREDKLEELLAELKQDKSEILKEIHERVGDKKRIDEFEDEIHDCKKEACGIIREIAPKTEAGDGEIGTIEGWYEFMNYDLDFLIRVIGRQAFRRMATLEEDEEESELLMKKGDEIYNSES